MKRFYIFFFFFLYTAFAYRSFLKIDENYKAMAPPHLLNLDSMKNDSIIIISKNKLNNSDFKELNMKKNDNSSFYVLETDTKKSEILNQNFHIFGISTSNKSKTDETLKNDTIIRNKTENVDCDKNKVQINVYENFLSNNFSNIEENFFRNETFKKIDELVHKERIPSNLKNLTINITYIILNNNDLSTFEKILLNHNLGFNELSKDPLSNFSQLLIFNSPKKEINENDKENISKGPKNNSQEFREKTLSLKSSVKNTNDFLSNAKRELNLNSTLNEKAKETINQILNGTKLENKALINDGVLKKDSVKPQNNQFQKSFEGNSNLKDENISFNSSFTFKPKNDTSKPLNEEITLKKSFSNSNLFKPKENDWEGILDSEGIPDDEENNMFSILNEDNYQNKSNEKSQKTMNISNSSVERFSNDKKSDLDFNDNQTGITNKKELKTKFDNKIVDELKSKINMKLFDSNENLTKEDISNSKNNLAYYPISLKENLTLKENNESNNSFTQQNLSFSAYPKKEVFEINYSEVPIYKQSTNNSIKFSEKAISSINLDSQKLKKSNEKDSKIFQESVSKFEDPIIIKSKPNTNVLTEISFNKPSNTKSQENVINYDNKKKKQDKNQESQFDYSQEDSIEKLETKSSSPIFREKSEINEFPEGLSNDEYINDKKSLDLKQISEPAFEKDALYEMNGMENNEFLNPNNNMMANLYDDGQGY